MKKNMLDRVSDFMAGKGFYIVLLLCVTALGVSGYYLFSGMDSGESQMVSGPVTVVVTPQPAPTPTASAAVAAVPPATASPKPAVTPTPAVQSAPAPTAAPATATASVFTWPVKGSVLRGWSVETLSYDQTMGDWRVHDGVDLAAELGTAVMAPAGGTVSDVSTDDLMGTTVTILHADGVISVCANLDGVVSVEMGDTVRTGDVIGTVGGTAIAESREQGHLHLSMTRDGVSVDPLEYLPKN